MIAFEFFNKFLLSARAGSVVRRICWISLVGVTLSVMSLLVVMSIMNALNKNIRERTLAIEPHLYIEMLGPGKIESLELNPAIARLRENKSNILHVGEYQDIILRTVDGKFRGAHARGLSKEGMKFIFGQMQQFRFNRERIKNKSDNKKTEEWSLDLEPGEILMGRDLAAVLGVLEGDTLTALAPEGLLLPAGETPRFEKLKVRRIVSTDIADVDAQVIFYYSGESLYGLKNSSSRRIAAEVWLKDPFDALDVKEKLGSFPGIQIQTWQERNSAIFQSLRLEKMAIGLFLGLASLIAGLSMISVMGLLVTQKRQEIALLQTMGLSRTQVRSLFLKLGMILGGMGLMFGTILGGGISFYLEYYPLYVLPDIYYDSSIPALVDFKFFFYVVVIGGFIAYLGSIISVRPVVEIEPSRALRK